MALDNKDKMKDLFSSKLQNFEPELPMSLWAGIDQSLPKQPGSATLTKTVSSSTAKKANLLWLKPIAAVASAVAMTISGVFVYETYNGELGINKDKKTNNIYFAEQIVRSSIDSVETIEDEVIDVAATTANSAEMSALVEKKAIQPKVIAKVAKAEELESKEDEHDQPVVETKVETVDNKTDFKLKTEEEYVEVDEVAVEEETKTSNKDRIATEKANKESTESIGTKDIKVKEKSNKEKKKRNRIPHQIIKTPRKTNLGIQSNLALNSEEKRQQGDILNFSSTPMFSSIIDADNMNYKMDHDQPISFGLTINRDISSNFAIETGIVYTYLSSTLKSAADYQISEKQKFHYLGIPISINYTFLRYHNLDAFISGGGMIQKDIKGSYTGSLYQLYKANNEDAEYQMRTVMSGNQSISQSKPQLSAHLKLGLSYPIYKKLYLYGTVGGAYYFDASNKYRTIYSDRQTQLDLLLGLKWRF